MKKNLLVLMSLLLIAGNVKAQLLIDGRAAAYDNASHTWLATIPEHVFGLDSTLTVTPTDGCQLTIDEETVTDKYTFTQISAKSRYAVTITNTDGNIMEGNICFTFLPIVRLDGTFGNDYAEGIFHISCPDSTSTDILAASIKWRGGTTNAPNKHKRNYKVKFPEDHVLLGLRDDNNWILDAGQPDVFRLRNRIAMDLWNDIARQPWYANMETKARNGVRGRVVELFLNDEYRGIYNLSENMDRKQLQIKKTDKKTGQIRGCLYKGVSWQGTQMFDSLRIYDNHSETLQGYEIKYPDLTDNDTTDWQPLVLGTNFALIKNDDDFEKQVEDYFDLPPMVDYSLFLSVVNGVDNSGKNMYWAVYDKTLSNRMTPAPWDLDATFGQRWGGLLTGGDDDHTLPTYKTDVDVYVFYRFYATNACRFNDQLMERYNELRQTGKPLSTDSLISRFTHYFNALKRSGAADRETSKWSGDSDMWGDIIDFDAEYQYICNWITEHMALIDQCGLPIYYTKDFFDYWAGITRIQSPITQHPANDTYYQRDDKTTNQSIFTLGGQCISDKHHMKPGIYIRGGRKIIVR